MNASKILANNTQQNVKKISSCVEKEIFLNLLSDKMSNTNTQCPKNIKEDMLDHTSLDQKYSFQKKILAKFSLDGNEIEDKNITHYEVELNNVHLFSQFEDETEISRNKIQNNTASANCLENKIIKKFTKTELCPLNQAGEDLIKTFSSLTLSNECDDHSNVENNAITCLNENLNDCPIAEKTNPELSHNVRERGRVKSSSKLKSSSFRYSPSKTEQNGIRLIPENEKQKFLHLSGCSIVHNSECAGNLRENLMFPDMPSESFVYPTEICSPISDFQNSAIELSDINQYFVESPESGYESTLSPYSSLIESSKTTNWGDSNLILGTEDDSNIQLDKDIALSNVKKVLLEPLTQTAIEKSMSREETNKNLDDIIEFINEDVKNCKSSNGNVINSPFSPSENSGSFNNMQVKYSSSQLISQEKEKSQVIVNTDPIYFMSIRSELPIVVITLTPPVDTTRKTRIKEIRPKPSGNSGVEYLKNKIEKHPARKELEGSLCLENKFSLEREIYNSAREKGTVINIQDETTLRSNLHLAAINGELEQAFCLVEINKQLGKDPSAIKQTDIYGKEALDYALENKIPLLSAYLKESSQNIAHKNDIKTNVSA